MGANELWIGMSGAKIPLHYEQAETVLIQINGFAEIVLFDPNTAPNLYPFPYGHPCSNKQSMVNLEFMQQNASIFKKFSVQNTAFDGNVYRAVLREGDVLHIPNLWWWELTNLNDFSTNIKFSSQPCAEINDTPLDIEQILN